MTDNRTRFATVPQSSRADWRRFRREAAAGHHGSDLAGASFFQRHSGAFGFLAASVLVVVSAVVISVDVATGTNWFAGIPWWATGLLVVNMFIVLVLGLATRRHSWPNRARARHRLRRFAADNGLSHEVDAQLPRRLGVIFRYGDGHATPDWCAKPTSTGFEIVNHHVSIDPGGAEGHTDRWGYVVFTLRDSFPHALVLPPESERRRFLPRKLRDVEPIMIDESLSLYTDKPDHQPLRALVSPELVNLIRLVHPRPFVEIRGNELYLYIGGGVDLTSPTLWHNATMVANRLVSQLVIPPNVELVARRHGADDGEHAAPGSTVI